MYSAIVSLDARLSCFPIIKTVFGLQAYQVKGDMHDLLFTRKYNNGYNDNRTRAKYIYAHYIAIK